MCPTDPSVNPDLLCVGLGADRMHARLSDMRKPLTGCGWGTLHDFVKAKPSDLVSASASVVTAPAAPVSVQPPSEPGHTSAGPVLPTVREWTKKEIAAEETIHAQVWRHVCPPLRCPFSKTEVMVRPQLAETYFVSTVPQCVYTGLTLHHVRDCRR